jgi:hypothetical protein
MKEIFGNPHIEKNGHDSLRLIAMEYHVSAAELLIE